MMISSSKFTSYTIMRGIAFLILLINSIKRSFPQQVHINPFDRTYPFGNLNVDDHQDEILDNLRENLLIHLKSEVLSNTFKNETKQQRFPTMRNLEFQKFLIKIQQTSDIPLLVPERITSEDQFKESLGGFCAVHNLDYWHFEWCHKKVIKQSHYEFSDYDQKFVLQASHLIGKYTSTMIEREGGNNDDESLPIKEVIAK